MSAGPKGLSLPPGEDRLDSWKEIAGYLGREVRTVQGWEKTEGLPVHRHQHARQGSVYAFRSELDAWREARRGTPEATVPAVSPEEPRMRLPALRVWSAIAALLVLVAGAVWWMSGRTPAAGEVPESVVVLP